MCSSHKNVVFVSVFFFSFNQSVRTDTNVTVLMLGLCHVSEVPCLLIFPVVITK